MNRAIGEHINRKDLIDFCLTFPAAYEDYPFDSASEPGAWAVMRHKANKKSFALIYERNDELCVNVKCDPFDAIVLRQAFAEVRPAYHMNKQHWNTVVANGDVPKEEIMRMIQNSYSLIKPKEPTINSLAP